MDGKDVLKSNDQKQNAEKQYGSFIKVRISAVVRKSLREGRKHAQKRSFIKI